MTDSSTTDTIRAIRASIEAIRNTDQADTIGRKCSLDIESDGTISLDTQHPDVNGVSMAIWNGLTLSYGLPMGVEPGAVADWLEEHLDDLQTLVEGMGRRWDGHNMVGTLTDEAKEIHNSWQGIESTLDSLPYVSEWEASEWLYPIKADIQGQATREAAVAMAVETVPSDGLWTDGGATSYISREGCAAVAGEWWDDAHKDDE